MAQLVHNYLDELDTLQDEIVSNADNILQAINIDDLLKSPESYLLSLSLSFLNEHTDEIEKAHKEGIKFAEKILKKS
mgnify:FL=1